MDLLLAALCFVAVCIVALAVYLAQRFYPLDAKKSRRDALDIDGTGEGTSREGSVDNYDPKEGMLIAVTGKNPEIRLPEHLTKRQRRVVLRYLRLGKDLGLAISYYPMGASVHAGLLDEFIESEKEYSDLGYRTIGLSAWEGLGGWNKPLPDGEGICVSRAEAQAPVLHGPGIKTALERAGRTFR